MKYSLEIFHPAVMDAVWVILESETPFMTISVGDIVNPYVFPDADAGTLLRVVSLEHTLTSGEHKISVYTEGVDDSEDVRLDP
jgi:hypothetical protein